MWMNENLICRLYREAVDKENQIKILAECNAVEQDAIIAILKAHGVYESPLTVAERQKKIVAYVKRGGND